jgi:hypothetical protein
LHLRNNALKHPVRRVHDIPDETPGEPDLPVWIFQPVKISIIMLVKKYPCAENKKEKKRSG